MQLGAFYPFSRNHNTIGARPQEPYLWESVARASRNALNIRYYLLPFYYTLFYQAHKFGATVVRPFFFEFPEDNNTPLYDRQFLVRSSQFEYSFIL
jgi:alpha-glucosidase (family GH31 glycosyl hydrolase)